MTPEQATEAVKVLMSDAGYMDFKPEDFMVCFLNARKGFYGKNYNRIDIQVLCGWVNAYSLDREDALIEHNKGKNTPFMTLSKEPLGPAFSDETKQKIAAIGKPKEVKPHKRERTIFDDFHDDFDKLVKEQDARRVPGPVFVEYESQLFDRTEYINYRYLHKDD